MSFMDIMSTIKRLDKTVVFGVLVALFVTTLLVSNIASVKLFSFLTPNLIIDGGTILFPLSYILGDIITEVYGFKKAKKVIFIGFFMSIVATLTFTLVAWLPPASGWELQAAYESIFGIVPRIVAGSLIAYLIGEIVNSYILSSLKNKTNGKYLFVRTIGSTLVAALLDTAIFSTIAFAGIIPVEVLLSLILTVYVIKVAVEIIITPITYKVIGLLKKIEGKDHFDRGISVRDII